MKQLSTISDVIAFMWPFFGILAVCAKCTTVILAAPGALPMNINFPYDWKQPPIYHLTCFYIYFTQINVALITAASDIFFPCCSLLAYQQFEILKSNFKFGFYKVLIRCGVRKQKVVQFIDHFFNPRTQDFDPYVLFSDVLMVIESEEFRYWNRENLKENIAHHQMLLEHCDEMNKYFSILLSVKVSCNFFYVVLMFFSVMVANNASNIIEAISYTSAGIIQLIIYSAFGQILTEGSNLWTSLYEVPWYLCDVSYRKMFVFVLMRSKNLVTTRAGDYFAMSAEKFLAFVKTMFSYATVLQKTLKK